MEGGMLENFKNLHALRQILVQSGANLSINNECTVIIVTWHGKVLEIN